MTYDSAHFPGGHIEGWLDAFKNMMAQFYRAVQAGAMPDNPQFATFQDGTCVMYIIDAIMKVISSSAGCAWNTDALPGSPGNQFMVACTKR